MARIVPLLILTIAPALGTGRAQQGLFLDISGSMHSYHADGTVAKLSTPLIEAIQSAGEVRVYGFNDQVHRFPSLAAISPSVVGGYTDIAKVVDRAFQEKLSLFWIITDNLNHDPGSVEGAGTERFYLKLRDEKVKRVTVFPVIIGPGKTALIVYAVLLDSAAEGLYDQGITGFQKGANAMLRTDALCMKPLDRGTITTTITPRTEGPARNGLEVYETGKPIRKTIDVKFQSSLRHIAITDSGIEVLRQEPRFQETSLLRADDPTIQIRPNRISNLPGGGTTAQRYEIEVYLSRLRLKPGIGPLWKAAFGKNSEEARFDTVLLIKVPGRNFRLHDDFLSRFNASTPQEAKATGHVFALDRLPELMSADLTSVEVHHEMVFLVKYPLYPTLIWLAAALVVIVSGVGAFKFAPGLIPSKKSKWVVSVEGEDASAALNKEGTLMVGDAEVGSVHDDLFTPAPHVELAGGAATAALEHGTILEIRLRRQSMRIKFEERGHREKPMAPEHREVRRRI